MPEDLWIERWLPVIGNPLPGRSILELGCGFGCDTEYLTGRGYRVIATDISEDALHLCSRRAPKAILLRHDLRVSLPFSSRRFPVIVASLCLHYFGWDETMAAVAEIHRCLFDNGLLLCRLNSINDINYGATGYPQINENYYQVDARGKRFFDERTIRSLFDTNWRFKSIEETTIHRYEKPKVAWELLIEKI